MAVLSEALRKRQNADFLFTGNDELDKAFALLHSPSPYSPKGIPANTFTEISGPSGSGKAAIWLALIQETLCRGMNVLYVGCDDVPFPYRRAMQLVEWNSKRFESRIQDVYIRSVEQLLLIDRNFDMASFGLVVFSHYDSIVKTSWDKASKEKVISAMMLKINSIRESATVLATAGTMKHSNEENVMLLAPATLGAKSLPGVVRLMIYKDTKGNCVLSTGEKFRVAKNGIIPATEPSGDAVPLHILSTKRRYTPIHLPWSQPLTPNTNQRKRRPSISSPSRPDKARGDKQPSCLGQELLALPSPRTGPQSVYLGSSQSSSAEHNYGDLCLQNRQGSSSPAMSRFSIGVIGTLTPYARCDPAPLSRLNNELMLTETPELAEAQAVQNNQMNSNDSEYMVSSISSAASYAATDK